jgi:hypothetical protein
MEELENVGKNANIKRTLGARAARKLPRLRNRQAQFYNAIRATATDLLSKLPQDLLDRIEHGTVTEEELQSAMAAHPTETKAFRSRQYDALCSRLTPPHILVQLFVTVHLFNLEKKHFLY